MATKKTKKPAARKAGPAKPKHVEYVLSKGSSRLLNARVDKEEIWLFVNGPAMLFGSARMLTSLDMPGGATFQAWKKLAASLSCTSLCGANGKTKIPVEVKPSRIGTSIEFSLGPMSMYQSVIVLKAKQTGVTLRQAIDDAFGNPKGAYSVVIVPEAATGHAEHDASIFQMGQPADGGHQHGEEGGGHHHG
ncbi:MAG: hypothetical protein FJW39_16280 [Acidobacteria bacterium]|nr:hypothetical protein [Acidobacteriota bacterium]